jgi:RNA polymerase sigma factor (sigma-70 family)
MTPAIAPSHMLPEQNKEIADAVGRERRRLWAFIRRRVLDDGEAEDILQDVLYELVIAYRQLQPLEEVGAWLFRVARNRIIDLFRRKRPLSSAELDVESLAADTSAEAAVAGPTLLEELLLPADESPDALLARELLLERLAMAVERLPPEQRAVFIAHEIEGVSFNEMVARTGVPLNTLLARKHYAVKHLRRELQSVRDEWLED